MLKAEFMKWVFRFSVIKLRLQLRYQRMNNNSKCDINFFSHWRVTRHPKAPSTPLELWKYANFLSFWIVVRVFRVQLGLICVRQIQVWPYLSVSDIDEQCEFLDRMDFDAIFQQINLRYEWAVRVSAFLTLNRMDVDMIFFHLITAFPFHFRISCKDSAPRLLRVFLRPPAKFRQSLAYFSAIPCEPSSWKIEIFSATAK